MRPSLYDIFKLPDCREFKWSMEPVQWADRMKTEECRPEYLCVFRRPAFSLNYWAIFKRNSSFITSFVLKMACDERDREGDWDTVANAIAWVKGFEHGGRQIFKSESIARYVGDLSPATIAVYQASENLRSCFPHLDEAIHRKNAESGFIYLLSDRLGHYKIGRTKDLGNRLYQLRTQPPFKIELLNSLWVPNASATETWLHHAYAKQRLNGEWFALSDTDLEFLNDWFEQSKREDDAFLSLYQEDWPDWKRHQEKESGT